MSKNEVLSPKKASKILNVNTKTLRRWSERGKIRSVTLPSGQKRYFRADIYKIKGEDLTKEAKKEKLSLSMIIILLWMWVKGLLK